MASMLSPIVSVWISSEGRRLVQVVPDSVRQVWDDWDLRISVLISFACQYLLLVFGKSRKRVEYFEGLVWATYLISDWVLGLSLGIISSKVGEQVGEHGENKQVLIAFWSTLLLVHVGGPPSITAESLEDNSLWRRTVLVWILQTARVLYIILLPWRSKSWLSYLSIGMLLVGFIKIGERVWAQYYASDLNEFNSERTNFDQSARTDPRVLFENFKLFFVSLFKDFVLSSEDLEREQDNFRHKDSERAFHFVEAQLGYAYDVLYTKAYVQFSCLGRALCACTASVVTTVFICFCIVRETEMHGVPKADRDITWLLVVEVVFQELLTVQEQVYSNWSKFSERCFNFVDDSFNESWRKIITKCNLLSFCLENNLDSWRFKDLKMFLPYKSKKIDKNLKGNIFTYFLSKSNSDLVGLFTSTSGLNFVIVKRGVESMKWTQKLEFHQSILTWHIATDLCYRGIDDIDGLESEVKSKVDVSKDLSEYMLYLLVQQRHMLPIGRGLITFPNTCSETSKFFQHFERKTDNMREACDKLLQFSPDTGSRSRSTSALSDARRLTCSLINEMELVQRWEFLEAVWIEILGYAATRCKPEEHAQQLKRGGEFLTHVWLLMAHLGLMEQFQVYRATTPASQEQSIDQTNQLQGSTDERIQIHEE